MEELTERQRAILQFVTEHIVDQRFPPTIREIGQAMGIRSTNGVNDHLKALQRKGFLERGEMKSRALVPTKLAWRLLGIRQPAGPPIPASEPTPPARSLRSITGGKTAEAPEVRPDVDTVEVPVLGRVAAGAPILAEESFDSSVRVDPSMLGRATRDEVFALRVKGDSMIGDGILDGDLLFVRRQQTARKGEIVVAMIEGEATVKRYYPEGDKVRLQPSNPRLQPIYIRRQDARDAAILGVAVGVFRQLG
ncbi:transcriptional repressor LexA [Vulgatibacter incomptus]|uniref:LexA repressor n=1 Tax=Vulgatibacter incomptus TaxID=1391653 RepID=A0A0K1PAS0_9BACT|nr:transcriptional repressor LexA [Vulgatibacter incomptus]AKU90511.1 SOS-response repressor and protease LexA [Vulgatibacter incomptus]